MGLVQSVEYSAEFLVVCAYCMCVHAWWVSRCSWLLHISHTALRSVNPRGKLICTALEQLHAEAESRPGEAELRI
jgi:hypothetical protein